MVTEYTKNGIDYKIITSFPSWNGVLERYENGILKFSCFLTGGFDTLLEVHLQRRFELKRLNIPIRETSTPLQISNINFVKGIQYNFVSYYLNGNFKTITNSYIKRAGSLEQAKEIFERL